ncbi:Uncharacterized protein PCOAH_00032120 [Plasmodium coatneyi]|uniref:Uncharacterized protein n=1 Tax=Plasmodium coatneyi TaxID=208452 RepID=A0A1B1E1W7_9APIC|nr:Uncharacterized protein PCOAH_00032120 [Plasmodium coatneyi]ANQ08897.1 Uncharacterized protein PCOAH_00032120 [Plasmodium coatneyi]
MLRKILFFLSCVMLSQLSCAYSSYKECLYVTNDEDILSYCKNESDCYFKNVDGSDYSTIICVCKKYMDDYFFAGPDCSIQISYHYQTMKNNEVMNTSWIEDLFNINSWKNEENRVGKICINPRCR